MPDLDCTSRITRVDVYARGALVTRLVSPAQAMPEVPVVLRIPGLTPLADAGSIRAESGGQREIVSLRSRLVVPEAPAAPGPALSRLRDLELARQALEAERAHLEWRRAALAQRELRTGLQTKGRFVDPAARAADALAVGGLFAALAADVDRRLADLGQALANNAREREAAELEAAQARSAERAGRGHPTLEVLVGLSAGPAIADLSVVYAVGAARWWPTYAVRLADSGSRAEWTLGALVAQASGEDWGDVRLGLTTADLVHSARLPSLPSLRIGRLQPVARTGYRAAPADLDALFEGWDRAATELGLTGPSGSPAPSEDTVTRTRFPMRADTDSGFEHDEVTPVFSLPVRGAAAPPPPQSAPAPRAAGPARRQPAPQDLLAEDAPAALPMAAGAATPTSLLASHAPPRPSGGGALRGAAVPAAEPAAVVLDRAIEPADTWLDFDSLTLAAPEDRALRGRLVREATGGRGERDQAVAAIESLANPGLVRDPLETRGRFDARWEADGRADVPSDSRPHRVGVGHAEGAGRPRLRTVPREVAEVYREVWLDNPFGVPLLAGPVDVFVEGALVTTSPIDPVDRGGTVRLGLGVEERVRVARNVSTEEGTAGLLGGSTSVEHVVTIDLRSSLGHATQVEVVDRIPVAGETDVEVSHSSRPEPTAYDQAERGRPVKGGLTWLVDLAAGGDKRIELRYRVKLPASSELVGGNRRE